ncbi:hypothetical protein GCM10009736_06330 [Actinomadura bangladeshensis]
MRPEILGDPGGALERQIELDPANGKADHLAEVGHEISFGNDVQERRSAPGPITRLGRKVRPPAPPGARPA